MIKEVEKPVEVIKEVIKEVEKPVEVIKEKIVEVTAVPLTGPKNAIGLSLPADALPLEKQIWATGLGNTGGGFGHIMQSLYNRAFEHNAYGESLTTLDIDYNVVPQGAESWTQSTDGLSWDFKLRKELVFSDGKPVKAEDWVYTLQRNMGNGYDFGFFYLDIKNATKVLSKEMPSDQLGISAVDDYTLRITTEQPTPYTPFLGVWFVVAPKDSFEKLGDEWSLTPEKHVSSGPYKLKQFDRGVKNIWGLNEKYKGNRLAYWNEIVEEKQPAGLPAYMAGDIVGYGIGVGTPPAEAALINANPILRAESHPQPATFTSYIGWNTLAGKFAPLDNPDVRLAMCKAIDKSTLIGELYRGFSFPAWGILPKGFPGYSESLKDLDPNKHDIEAAKALLAKAGYPDGKGFPTFELWMRAPGDLDSAVCQALQARWKENLGINVELKPADFQTFTPGAFKDRVAPMYYVQYSMDYPDPSTFLGVFRSEGGRHPHDGKAWDAAYAKANYGIKPAEQRFKELTEVEKELVNSTAYYFLASPFSTALWRCNLSGPSVQQNKDGFRFSGGGGPGSIHAWEGMYYSDSACRAGLT